MIISPQCTNKKTLLVVAPATPVLLSIPIQLNPSPIQSGTQPTGASIPTTSTPPILPPRPPSQAQLAQRGAEVSTWTKITGQRRLPTPPQTFPSRHHGAPATTHATMRILYMQHLLNTPQNLTSHNLSLYHSQTPLLITNDVPIQTTPFPEPLFAQRSAFEDTRFHFPFATLTSLFTPNLHSPHTHP